MYVAAFLCLIAEVVIGLASSSDVITFGVTWPNGTVTSFSYRRSKSGDCLYDREKRWLTCTMSHDYEEIQRTWTEEAEEIRYVSVQCQESTQQIHPHVCFCQHPDFPPVPLHSPRTPPRPLDFCQVEELSAAMFKRLNRMEALDLSDNVLHEIPRDVLADVTNLRFLSLSFNPLRALPDGMACNKPSLQVLLLRHLGFDVFPGNIFRCEDGRNVSFPLRYLDISQSHVTELGGWGLAGLRQLELLNLSVNLLQEIPNHALTSANSLRYLDLSHNFLSQLPPLFCSSLGRLEMLDLTMNVFDEIDFERLTGCQSLTSLDLSDNTVVSLTGLPLSLPSLRHLELAGNHIRNLSTPFVNMGDNSSLETLDLSRNVLDLLVDDAFQGMNKLQLLNLSGNVLNVQSSLARVFWPLTSLRVLDLSHNGLTSLPERAFLRLGELRELHLCNNYLVNIGGAVLSGLRRLDTLHLQQNVLTSLGRAALAPLVSVTLVNLSQNALTRLDLSRPLPAARVLDISHNNLEVFPSGLRGAELRRLNLHDNQITWLPRGALGRVPKLERLDVSDNRIAGIDVGVFLTCRALTHLHLGNNLISTSLGPGIFRGANVLAIVDLNNNSIPSIEGAATPLPGLRVLNVSHNAIGRLERLLDVGSQSNATLQVDLTHCELTHVGAEAFSGMTSLRSVDLRWNHLATFPRFRGTGMSVRFLLQHNPLVCTCELAWFAQHELHVEGSTEGTGLYRADQCSAPPRGWMLPMASMTSQQFYCRENESDACPEGCTCFSHDRKQNVVLADCARNLTHVPAFLPLTAAIVYMDGNAFGSLHALMLRGIGRLRVKELYLNGSSITSLDPGTFKHAPSLAVLHLGQNRLSDLHPDTFRHTTSLVELHLQNNQLTSLRPGLLASLTSLRLLDVSGNVLRIMAPATISELSAIQRLRYIYLSGNPWECACANVDFRQWLALYEERVMDRRQLHCSGRLLLGLDIRDFSCSQSGLKGDALQAAILLPLATVLLVVLVALCYVRNFLITLAYTRCGCQCLKDDVTPIKHVTVYDVAVVHDERDVKCSWWVEHVLVPRMRQGIGRFRYCVHVMGPASGSSLPSEIASGGRLSVADDSLTSLQQARSTLLVISRTFPLCATAMTYFRHAQMLSRTGGHGLCMVVLGDVTRGMLDTELRAQLFEGNFLSPCSPMFWDRLAFSLPVPRHCASPLPRSISLTSRIPSSPRLAALEVLGRRRSDTQVILSELTDVTDSLGVPDPLNLTS